MERNAIQIVERMQFQKSGVIVLLISCHKHIHVAGDINASLLAFNNS